MEKLRSEASVKRGISSGYRAEAKESEGAQIPPPIMPRHSKRRGKRKVGSEANEGSGLRGIVGYGPNRENGL